MTETMNKEITETEEASAEQKQEAVSDSKMLLAPLAKYAVAAVVVVGIIVTTAIVLNKDLDTVDEEIASIEAGIVQQELAETKVEAPITNEVISEAGTPVEEPVAQTTTELVSPARTPVSIAVEAETATANTAVAEALVTEAAVVSNTKATPAQNVVAAPVAAIPQEYMPPVFDHKARIAEQHAYIAKQDQAYLDTLRVRQAERIKTLQAQLARQQKRIEAIEKRDQETYEYRAASIKRMQQAREESLNRI